MNIPLESKSSAQKIFNFIFIKNFTVIVCLFLLALAGTLAYRNTFGAPFIFDDLTQILQNPNITSWHWPWAFIENNRRPFLYATLAFNFHFDGFNPFGYHSFNIRTHILAAMMLFLLVRKTLRLSTINEIFRRDANILALSAAMIWLLHPIHTQAVTYIIQRAESLMGLLFLTTLYLSSQYLTSRKVFWLISAGLTSLLAGLTKEVTLVLPLMVLFYDRTFISADFRTTFKNNWWLYFSLSVTWLMMIYLYLTTRPEEKLTAGFGMQGMSPLLYAINQPKVILHYLRLSLWPDPLVFDYDWPAVTQLRFLLPSIALVASWVLVLVLVYRRFKVVSFLGLSFLILLLPSSSIIPLQDLIFEYRIYLSLSCGVIMLVLALKIFVENFVHERNRKVFFILVVTGLSLMLGELTYQRNKVYASEEKVWLDIIRKQPTNARAYNNLGEFWLRKGREAEAKECFLKSIAIDIKYPDVFTNMATVLGKEGKVDEAIVYARKAIVINPDFAVGYNNLGSALSQAGRYAEAAPNFEKTLDLGFIREGVFINLAMAYNNSGQKQKAIKVLNYALKFNPNFHEAAAVLKEILSPH